MAARTQHADGDRLCAALTDMAAEQGTALEQLAAPPGYAHLPLAVIDSIYSLRSPYSAARAAVSAYCAHANIEDRGTAGSTNRQLVEHTVADFLAEVGGPDGDKLATCFGGGRYKAPGTNVLKAEVCVAAADALRVADVNTRRDLDDDTRFASAKGNWKAVRGSRSAVVELLHDARRRRRLEGRCLGQPVRQQRGRPNSQRNGGPEPARCREEYTRDAARSNVEHACARSRDMESSVRSPSTLSNVQRRFSDRGCGAPASLAAIAGRRVRLGVAQIPTPDTSRPHVR